jgi:uncharacterized protein YjbI with pentapeptide repeats
VSGLGLEIVTRLAGGQGLDGLGLGTVDGRVDLRGLAASGEDVGGPAEIVVFREVQLEGLDLRGARLSGWRLHGSTLRDCRLDGADCRDWRLWDSLVDDCGFAGADLEGAAVGTGRDGRGNSWKRVDFTRAGFRVGVSDGAHYQNCDFFEADLTDVRFRHCAFVRCRFGGKLRNVLFDGRRLEGQPASPPLVADFSASWFDRVEFLGYELEGITLPDDLDLRLIRRFPCAVNRALAALPGNGSSAVRVLRADLEGRLRLLAAGSGDEDANVFNRRDYLAFGEELAALAEAAFVRAEAACLGD